MFDVSLFSGFPHKTLFVNNAYVETEAVMNFMVYDSKNNTTMDKAPSVLVAEICDALKLKFFDLVYDLLRKYVSSVYLNAVAHYETKIQEKIASTPAKTSDFKSEVDLNAFLTQVSKPLIEKLRNSKIKLHCSIVRLPYVHVDISINEEHRGSFCTKHGIIDFLEKVVK